MRKVTPRGRMRREAHPLFPMHERTGQAAVLALFVLLIVAFALVVLTATLMGSMRRTELHQERLQAQYLAEMGIEYALEQLNHGDWLQQERPIRFASEQIPEAGNFQVEVTDVPGTAELCIVSVGREESGRQAQISVRTANPTELTRHIRNVYNYDYAKDKFDEDAVVEFGTHGVGVNGIVQELVTVPPSGKVTLACVSDPAFGGLIPNSESITTWFGERYRRREILPPAQDEYVVDYFRAKLTFSPVNAGDKLLVFYDYLRRVPRPPGPYVFQLPYTPARDRSELVLGPDGQSFFRDRVFPQLQDHYFFEPDTGALRFSEHNTAQPLVTNYHFLGTRMTGSIRVNGSVRWGNRNLVYLFRSRGDQVEVSGTYQYRPGAKVSLVADTGREIDPLQAASECYVHKAEPAPLVPLALNAYGKLADRERGGDGLYICNPKDRQDFPSLAAEWQAGVGGAWQGDTYEPPGEEIDLGDTRLPRNGVIYGEGNLRIEGRLPEATQLTVVSAGTIYIEGDLQKSDPCSTVALLADQHVCINAARMRRKTSLAKLQLYVAALIYARRGSFAVVPGGGDNNELIVYGAINENRAYPNAEWARAFGAIEHVYDAALRDRTRRPPDLVVPLSWHQGPPLIAQK